MNRSRDHRTAGRECRADPEPRRHCRRAWASVGEALALGVLGRRRALSRWSGRDLAERRCPGRGGAGRAAVDHPAGRAAASPTYDECEALVDGLERGDARLPAPALLRGPADRARQPGAPAQPARRALPRPDPSATHGRSSRAGRGSSAAPAATTSLEPLDAASPGSARPCRTVFPAAETIGARRRRRRVVVLVDRDDRTSAAGSALLRADARRGPPHRVWIEATARPDRGRAAPARRARPRLTDRRPRGTRVARMCGRYASSRRPRGPRRGVRGRREPGPRAAGARLQRRARPRRSTPSSSGRPIRRARRAEPPQRQLRVLRWGLVPSWAKDPSIGNRMINARMETVAEKPAFRGRSRRAAACCRPTATSSGTPPPS